MPIVDDVTAAIAEAMRRHETTRLSALRMFKAALMNRSVEKGRDLDDQESRQVAGSLIKQRKDSIEQFERGGRPELAAREAAEITILESFLPPAADEALIARVVSDTIAELGATSPKDMGRVMKAVTAALAAYTADGKTVSDIVRAQLSERKSPQA